MSVVDRVKIRLLRHGLPHYVEASFPNGLCQMGEPRDHPAVLDLLSHRLLVVIQGERRQIEMDAALQRPLVETRLADAVAPLPKRLIDERLELVGLQRGWRPIFADHPQSPSLRV